MKQRERIFLIIGCAVALCFLSANVNADEITIFRGSYLTYFLDSAMDSNLEFRFDDKRAVYYLFYQRPITDSPVWISLTEAHLTTFRNNLKKFIEWDAIARRENASISRELPDSAINRVEVIDSYSKTEEGGLNLSFRFDTDTPAARKVGKPLLSIGSNEVYVWRNNRMATMQISMQLTGAQGQSLLNAMEPANITNTLERIKRQDDLFK
jgi:hypothetical protein